MGPSSIKSRCCLMISLIKGDDPDGMGLVDDLLKDVFNFSLASLIRKRGKKQKRPTDEKIREAVLGNQLHSVLMDCRNTKPLQLWQLLTNERYKDDVFYLPECGATVIMHYSSNTLFIDEVLAPVGLPSGIWQRNCP